MRKTVSSAISMWNLTELKRTTNTIKSVKVERLLNTKWSISTVRLHFSEHIMQSQFHISKVTILPIESMHFKAAEDVLDLRWIYYWICLPNLNHFRPLIESIQICQKHFYITKLKITHIKVLKTLCLRNCFPWLWEGKQYSSECLINGATSAVCG